MRRLLLCAVIALLAGCATERDNTNAGWLAGTWLTSEVTAVTGGIWTLQIPSVPPKGGIEAIWTPAGAQPMPAVVTVTGDSIFVMALGPQGAQANLKRETPTRMAGIVEPSGPNAISVPVTFLKR